MATVTATLRVKKLYFESSPMWTTWDDMQITSVKFYVSAVDGVQTTQIIDGVIGTEFITASATLESGTNYSIKAVAYSPYHTSGISGAAVAIDSDDTTTYYNIEAYVLDKDTSRPIEDVIFTLDPGGTEEATFTSRADGLIWLQRIPAGTYTYTATKAGVYVAGGGTITLGGLGSISGNIGFILLEAVV
jgi:hypothetical protein